MKRKVVRNIDTGKQELVQHEEEVMQIRAMGEHAPEILKEKLQEMPYCRIVKLDESIYGDLYLGHLDGQKYDILTKQGVVIGHYNVKRGYYYAYMNDLLPKEAAESMDRRQSCVQPISLEEAISDYIAKNPDSKEYIPQDLYERFPDLSEQIDKIDRKRPSLLKAKNVYSHRSAEQRAEQKVKKAAAPEISTLIK